MALNCLVKASSLQTVTQINLWYNPIVCGVPLFFCASPSLAELGRHRVGARPGFIFQFSGLLGVLCVLMGCQLVSCVVVDV